jgi:hypothetical protein
MLGSATFESPPVRGFFFLEGVPGIARTAA